MTNHAFIDRHPEPGTDPIARLRHTLDVYANVPGGALAIRATTGVYGDGVNTGLSWDDLRAIADRVGA